ncbi:lysophospholipid acyltransferase family protein [Solimonas terrae]|uniref:1-acyl-sn-glycerol-3-phosphate acyltransferase n=1 Tax=Solimonas terrae TaxID=1396819 RepID=A0A6M2BTP3_9GAMM|nr:lysophospholipid acyltransferase family protein [Solimonas terrae]NGY05828.1 1-acyl-sn-glycerol-3-phosphate acyltransferase [Solimonas terrae]
MPARVFAVTRAVLRGALVIVHLVIGLLMAVAAGLDFFEWLDRARLAGWWHRVLLRILGVHVRRHGQPTTAAHLSVANHISWLDIPVINASEPVRFVAKSEIRNWPLAGWLATAAGSFYLRRGKGDSPRLLDRLSVYLRNGGSVALFPEGTTTDGSGMLRFHARMFAPAIEARCAVQPIALRYDGVDGRAIAPFIGDDDLLHHVLRVLMVARLDVEVTYCAPIEANGRERTDLANAAQAGIEQALGLQPNPVAASTAPPIAAAA